ncbi:FAD-dependent oxidoreductase, partial [Aeromonas veronii]|uniref:FAD-dependent oxidoreductase n=1 Tax=Aeromonas veronii TaxID=654 RepID=UPI003D208FE3
MPADCHKFTTLLAALATDMGVCFENERNIIGLRTDGGRISAVETDRGAVAADAYLVAMGSYASALLRPLGIAVPI